MICSLVVIGSGGKRDGISDVARPEAFFVTSFSISVPLCLGAPGFDQSMPWLSTKITVEDLLE